VNVAELKQKLLRGGVYLALRQGLSLGLSLIGLLVITRSLGPAQYGWLMLALSWVTLVTEVVDLGLPYYLIRYQRKELVLFQGQVLTFMVALSSLLALGLVLLAPTLADWLKIPPLVSLVLIMSPAIVLDACGRVPMALLERELRYQNTSVVEIGALIIYYAVAVLLIFLGFGIWGVAYAYLARALFQTVAAFRFYPVRLRGLGDLKLLREALAFGVPYSLARWLSLWRGLFISLLLGKFVGAEAVGIVGMTTRIVEALCVVKVVILQLGMGGFAQIQGQLPVLRRALSRGMAYFALLLLPLLSVFACLSPVLVPWVLGPKWSGIVGLFPFVALAFFARFLFDLHSLVLFTEGQNYDVLRFQVVQLGIVTTLLLVGVIWGTGAWGLGAYAGAELAGLMAYLLLHQSVSRLVGSPDYRPVLWLLAGTLGILFGGLYLSPWLGLILLSGGVAMALSVSESLRSIPSEVLKSFKNKINVEAA
jgi:O-antigen/teichoic acid export membrane protein